MGLFSRKKELRAETIEAAEIIDSALLSSMLFGSAVDREMALQVPTVSGGVDLIAAIIAGTPIKLYREKDGKTEETKDGRVRLLNDETGDTLDANQFWRAIVRDYYLGKGGYAYIRRLKGEFKSIHYVDERNIAINKNADPIFKDFKINVNGSEYESFEFLKILRNTRDGASGTPITAESSKLIEVAYQALCFESNLVKKGGNKKGFLKSQKSLTKEAMAGLKEAYSRLYSNNNDNVVILNNGLEFQESSNTSVEMQLNENKLTNAGEFAKIFHISTDAMSGTAGEQDIASLARLAAIPLMKTIECALNRDFLLEREKGEYYWAFDTKELLKGDMKTRFEAYKTALEANFMQPDEVRYAEDMEPLGFRWIKLGLNDVLYDPETNTVYTPNTNKTAVMGENDLPIDGDGADDGIEPRASEDYVQLPNGKMNGRKPKNPKNSLTNDDGSGNLQSSMPTWTNKQAKEPFDYWELSEDKNAVPRRWEPKGFSHKIVVDDHFGRHGKSVGASDVADYEAKAIEFLKSPRGKHGDAFIRKSVNGEYEACRYDYDSKLFAVMWSDGTVKTFWNLSTEKGADAADKYWREQKNGK